MSLVQPGVERAAWDDALVTVDELVPVAILEIIIPSPLNTSSFMSHWHAPVREAPIGLREHARLHSSKTLGRRDLLGQSCSS